MAIRNPVRRELLWLALLGACAGRPPAPPVASPQGAGWSCVPYARSRSGIDLAGDAWAWWDAAAGRHRRDRQPRPGAVLVLARTSRLPRGHVAVVTRIAAAREIRVDHANWAAGADKGREARDQAVIDVSAANDWSLVRVWHAPSGRMGESAHPAFGFIHPGRA